MGGVGSRGKYTKVTALTDDFKDFEPTSSKKGLELSSSKRYPQGWARAEDDGAIEKSWSLKTTQTTKSFMSSWSITKTARLSLAHARGGHVTKTLSRKTVVDMPDVQEIKQLAKGHKKMLKQSGHAKRGSILNDHDSVECEATRPDWGSVDVLIMSLDEAGRGKFFSERQRSVGFWYMERNSLKLSWGAKGKLGGDLSTTDILIAVSSERHFVNKTTDMHVRVRNPKTLPSWFKVSCLSDKLEATFGPSLNFECPCCYFDLFLAPVSVMRNNSRRICGHYIHHECGQTLLARARGCGKPAQCPTCFETLNELKQVPNIVQKPREWFSTVDADYSQSLSEHEIVEALGSVLPADRRKLEKLMHDRWDMWDPDGDGGITMAEFLVPRTGLKDFILTNINLFRLNQNKREIPPKPDEYPYKWFMFFDNNGNGFLDREELVRGLIRTYCVTEGSYHPILYKAREMREVGFSLWVGLGYTPFESIDYVEFSRPFGLMDQFIHNFTQLAMFGDDDEHVLT